MPKLKTNKSILKRVKITKSGKIKRIPLQQSHCLAKMSGRKKQTRRKLVTLSEADKKAIKKYLPYN